MSVLDIASAVLLCALLDAVAAGDLRERAVRVARELCDIAVFIGVFGCDVHVLTVRADCDRLWIDEPGTGRGIASGAIVGACVRDAADVGQRPVGIARELHDRVLIRAIVVLAADYVHVVLGLWCDHNVLRSVQPLGGVGRALGGVGRHFDAAVRAPELGQRAGSLSMGERRCEHERDRGGDPNDQPGRQVRGDLSHQNLISTFVLWRGSSVLRGGRSSCDGRSR